MGSNYRNADKIYGYGFRPDEFYVLIDDKLSPKGRKALEEKIQKQLSKSKEFKMNVKFENSKGVSFTKHLGSGSRVLPNKLRPDSYGTLGGFAQINSTDVVGLTSSHVIRQDVDAYVNKRPMGHIAHLRKQFKSINTYNHIITLIRRRKIKYELYDNLLFFSFESSSKDALCQNWLKLAQWFWRRDFFNFVYVFSLFLLFPLGNGFGPSFKQT